MTTTAIRSFAVVPAAGNSVRMGQPKLMLPWDHQTVIERVLTTWRAAGVSEIIVVVSPLDPQLAEVVRLAGVHVVVPHQPPPDMKASVQHGLTFVTSTFRPAPRDAWLLAPADMPLLPAPVISSLLRLHQESGDQEKILVPQFGMRRGHPVLFPWTMAEGVARLETNQGIDSLVRRGPTLCVETDDERILADVDTPDDYHRLRPRRL